MAKKTNDYWRERIKQLTVNNDERGLRFGPESVLSSLQTVYDDWPEGDRRRYGKPPSKASIGRIQHDARKMPKEEREHYLWFFWPESMETRLLPWEATAAALEILGLRFWRPTIRQARWFWRVSIAAPDLSAEERLDLARWFASREVGGQYETEEVLRGLEGYVRFAPWRSDQNKHRYDDALTNGIVPPMPQRGSGIFRRG